MEQSKPWVDAVIAVTIGGSLLVGAYGAYVGTATKDDPTAWFVLSGVFFGIAILVPVFVWLIRPMTAKVDAWANRTLADAKASNAIASSTSAALPRSAPAAPIAPVQRLLSPNVLTIKSAMYGASATSQFADVTERVTGLVQEGCRLDMVVDNENLGVDPALNQVKELRLTYEYNGEGKATRYPEGKHIVLP
jgi:hypothetical protein